MYLFEIISAIIGILMMIVGLTLVSNQSSAEWGMIIFIIGGGITLGISWND